MLDFALAFIFICLVCYLGAAELKSRAEAHEAELKKERDEVSRLKAELEKAQSRHAELEKSAAEQQQLRVEETRKLEESFKEFESRATSAEGELEALKTKIGRWLVEISAINSEMNSKSFPLLSLPDIQYMPTYNLSWC